MNRTRVKYRSNLFKALLASTILTLPTYSNAALIPIAADTNTTVTPDLGQGYFFVTTALFPATLTVNDGYNIGTSAAIAGVSGEGSIDAKFNNVDNVVLFAGGGSVASDIGFSNPIGQIILDGAAGKTVAFGGNIVSNVFEFTDDGTATIASNKTISAPVTASADGLGTLTYLGNTTVSAQIGDANALEAVNFSGASGTTGLLNADIFAADTNVNNGGTLSVTAPRTITGNLTISNGTLALTQVVDPLSVTDDFDLQANTILSLDMGSAVDAGLIDAGGTASVSANSKLVIQNAPGAVPGGKAIIPIVEDSMGGGANLNPIPVFSSSLLTTFSTQVTGNLLELVIQTKTVTSVLSMDYDHCNVNKLGIIAIVDDISGMELSGELLSIVNQLGLFTTGEEICHSLLNVSPIVDSAIVQESFENQDYTFDNLSQRINKIQFCKSFPNHYACKAPVGYAAGDFGNPDGGIWLRTFGRSANQDERDGIEGYENSSVGIIGGADILFSQRALGGVAFSWSHLNLDHDISDSDTSVNSYQLSLYGSYDFKSPLYLIWNLALAYNDYAAERNVLFGNLVLPTTGRYHGWQTGGKVEFGYDCRYIKYFDDFFHIQPSVSLYYSHLDLSSYTERGANTANQFVESAEFNMLKAGLGYKVIYDYPYHGILYQTDLHIRGFYDFIGDPMELTSQFVGAGPSFQTEGLEPARASVNLGVGVTAYSFIGFYLTATYDFLAKQDYHANSGYLTLRYEW